MLTRNHTVLPDTHTFNPEMKWATAAFILHPQQQCTLASNHFPFQWVGTDSDYTSRWYTHKWSPI